MVMEMESTRRSTFDRSREPGLKKPRLADEQPNPNGRPFPQRSSVASLPPTAAARFRVNSDRDSENNDSSRGGGGYQPQPQQYHELVSQYKTALAELTFNSKPIITNLTIIAGENLHAAKAIASTVCNNILEVPSDQKLPSLYLLDSIVKNIARDYIKYFASRLPEVFCKAYKQVDSPVHQSMRHLFGTWKGVFPLQSLQSIEKELGFGAAVNGSSTGAAPSRPESQARRPQHSIHVNPKYLEIQRLQQSNRAKGMANDVTAPMTNPVDDIERPERASNIVSGRPWIDPSLKIPNVQRSHRETLSEPVHEKKIPAVYGDNEYNSDISGNSGSILGRIGGRVEPISSQRNGFSMKHGINYSKPNSALSASWKNSEEEEFMWDMHSRLSDQDTANLSINSKKDHWTHDGLEKLDFGSQLRKSQTGHEALSGFDRENSSDSLPIEHKEQLPLGHRLSTPWRLKESLQTGGIMTPGNSITNTSSEIEGYPETLGGVPIAGSSSLSRVIPRPRSSFLANTPSGSTGTLGQPRIQSLGVTSPSGQSPLPQKPPYLRQQLLKSSEQDLPLSLPHSQLDYKAQPLSGNLFLPNNRVVTSQKLQPGCSSQIQNTNLPPVSKIGTPPSSETSEHSSTSSLLAAVMKSGILANLTPPGLPSQTSEPPVPTGPPPKVTPSRKRSMSALTTHVSEEDMSVISQKEEEKPLIPPGQTSNKAPTNPLSNLLSSLVAKGLISASSKSESSSSSSEKTKPKPTPTSTIPNPPTREKQKPPLAPKVEIVPHHPELESKGLIGLQFKSDILRESHPPVIDALFDNLLHRCNICGLKLKVKERLDRHMEWHAWRKPEEDGKTRVSRRWYSDSEDWVSGKGGFPFEIESSGVLDKEDPMILADENQCACVICGELFEDYYSLKRKKWMFKGALNLPLPTTTENVKGPIVHVDCVSESSVSDLGLAASVKMEKDG